MHALIADDAVVKYPYTIGMLRKDNPNTSFPKHPTNDLLRLWGLEVVVGAERPVVDHTQNLTEGTPILEGGQWTQVWLVANASAEEVAERSEQKAQEVRRERDDILALTDWMALTDNTMTESWATYRQALRDITSQEGFPFNVTWPNKPE